MALVAYYVPGALPSKGDLTALGSGTPLVPVALPNADAFKLVADATDGFVIFLTKAFWSVKHTGLATDGSTAATATQYYASGLTAPTASYAATDDITRASIPLVSGQDEIISTSRQAGKAIFFKSSSGAPVLLFRRNEDNLSNGVL